MNSKGIGGDFSFVWPTAEIAVMGAKGAIAILYKKELLNAENPDALKKEFTEKYKEEVVNPYIADDKGYIDEVIDPATTRHKIIRALGLFNVKQSTDQTEKHGNILYKLESYENK